MNFFLEMSNNGRYKEQMVKVLDPGIFNRLFLIIVLIRKKGNNSIVSLSSFRNQSWESYSR